MTENDYIAEYVKEKRPDVLGVDFAFWKMSKIILNFGDSLVEAFKNISFSNNSNDDCEKTQTNENERQLWDGKCPFTDEYCRNNRECSQCDEA